MPDQEHEHDGGELHPENAHPVNPFAAWVKEYKLEVGIGLGVLLLVGIIYAVLRTEQESQTQAAYTELAKLWPVGAASITEAQAGQLDDLAATYAGTEAAPIILLRSAYARYDLKQYDAAEKAFRKFLATYPDHYFTPQAMCDLAICLEAKGFESGDPAPYAEAIDLYEQVSKQDRAYLYPDAKMGTARCLERVAESATGDERMAKLEEARRIYGEIVDGGAAQNFPGRVIGMARLRRTLVGDAIYYAEHGGELKTPGAGDDAAPSQEDLQRKLQEILRKNKDLSGGDMQITPMDPDKAPAPPPAGQ